MFGVVWTEQAMDDLADLYVAATVPDREWIAAAVGDIERRLREGAPLVGESRSGGRRIAFAPPLGILFEVDPATRVAWVGRVWRYVHG